MKKQNPQDALQLLEQFQRKVLEKKPPMEEMINEIHMMKFKIKPVQGDFSKVNFRNDRFIETLWSLGKLDEFFHVQYPQLKKQERNAFYTYFDAIQKRLQEDLNKLNLKTSVTDDRQAILEMEIFKERSKKARLN